MKRLPAGALAAEMKTMNRHIEYTAQCAFVAAMRRIYPNVMMTCATVRMSSARTALNNYRMGYLKGTPDIFIMEAPYAGRCGLWLEFKSTTGKQTPEQKQFQIDAERRGHEYAVVRSAAEAIKAWDKYRTS